MARDTEAPPPSGMSPILFLVQNSRMLTAKQSQSRTILDTIVALQTFVSFTTTTSTMSNQVLANLSAVSLDSKLSATSTSPIQASTINQKR